MAFAENKTIELPQTTPGTVIVGTEEKEVRQMSEKGYDFIRGAGAAFVGDLEGSVSGLNWTSIVSLAASAQGVVPVHFNLVRANVGTGGALGTGTKLVISGKVL